MCGALGEAACSAAKRHAHARSVAEASEHQRCGRDPAQSPGIQMIDGLEVHRARRLADHALQLVDAGDRAAHWSVNAG
ncbi:hypothetical protein [Novosphingobium sp. M1R2S20]|uniref:Uncharacterized protein n=1 Tax=Novosphingobium rhizovicinum TaxID=3228928 RepID=A0ABV3R9I8_9SPHN